MAFDKFGTEQWVGAFKGDQWFFKRRQNKGKHPAGAGMGAEPLQLPHWRTAHLERGHWPPGQEDRKGN